METDTGSLRYEEGCLLDQTEKQDFGTHPDLLEHSRVKNRNLVLSSFQECVEKLFVELGKF